MRFRLNGIHGAETVRLRLDTPSGTQVIQALFNNGHPEGKDWYPSDGFTNVPVGTWTISFKTDRLRTGTFTVTINSDCSVQPAVLAFP